MIRSNHFDCNKAAFLDDLPNKSCFLFTEIFVSTTKSFESQQQKGEFAVHLFKSPIRSCACNLDANSKLLLMRESGGLSNY